MPAGRTPITSVAVAELLARVGLVEALLQLIASRLYCRQSARSRDGERAHSRCERSQLLRRLAESGVLRHTLDRLLRRRYRGVELSCQGSELLARLLPRISIGRNNFNVWLDPEEALQRVPRRRRPGSPSRAFLVSSP